MVAVVGALTSPSASCEKASVSEWITVVDSSGVEVVANLPGSVEVVPEWSLSPDPEVDIGSAPTLPLFRVVDVAPLRGGRVCIAMTAPPQVLVVDQGGALLTTLGQAGEGPGEFAGVSSVVPLGGDSLAVWDSERRRISVFDEAGALGREVDLRQVAPLSWTAAPDLSEAAARTVLAASGPEAFWLFSVGVLGPGEGVFRPEAPSYRLDTTGEVETELGSFPGDEVFKGVQLGLAPYPFGAMTFAASAGGSYVVGTGSVSELRVYGSGGDLVRVIRWPDRDRSVSGERLAIWDSFLEGHLASLSGPEADFRREALEQMPEPQQFPAFGPVVVSDRGRVWVAPYQPGQQDLVRAYMGVVPLPGQRWLVFGINGEMMATIRIPPGFMVSAVRDGRVWGVHRDALDVESVRAYRLQLPVSRASGVSTP